VDLTDVFGLLSQARDRAPSLLSAPLKFGRCGTSQRVRRLPRIRFPSTKSNNHPVKNRALKEAMQILAQNKPLKTLSQPLPKKQPRKSVTPWQPLSGGLTREEIRAIIIDQIG
jgi:hypothetical protein